MGGPLYFCIRYVGFEPEGSWKRAGGTFQPEAACPAGQVESLRVHHVGASCISLAPIFYAFGKEVRVRSFRCSSLAKLQPLALGCSLVLRGMTLDVISFAATFSLLEQTSLLTHSVAAPLKPGPADAWLRVCFFASRIATALSISWGIESTIRSAPLLLLFQIKSVPCTGLRFGVTWL